MLLVIHRPKYEEKTREVRSKYSCLCERLVYDKFMNYCQFTGTTYFAEALIVSYELI